jgi:hypothetical protein
LSAAKHSEYSSDMAKIQRNEPCPCGSGRKFKKCCGSVTAAMAKAGVRLERSVRAYSDETGNSGNNLFDPGQPYFWTGTLVCEADVDREGAKLHAKCLALSGESELHGNQLGLSRIEKIAPLLQELLAKVKAHFLFTRIEKHHLAATKFFDVLMDSGVNHAISNLQYAYRTLRLSLAVQFIQMLDDSDRQEFWQAYENSDREKFRAVLARVLDRLLAAHEAGLYYERTVQLLRDGIEWGIKYPEPLLEERLGELDSPNVVAFSLLVAQLHELHQKTGIRVRTFVHDEQDQFGKSLALTFKLLKRLSFERTITSSMLDIKELPTFDSELEMRSSQNSIGLQLADVGLWLMKRFYDSDGKVHGKSKLLADQIIRDGSIEHFTLPSMQEGVEELMKTMYALPFDMQDETSGREVSRQFEEQRQERMKQPPEGLYEREIPKWSVSVAGGKATSIPPRHLCAGKRHDTRLTKCYCDLFAESKLPEDE